MKMLLSFSVAASIYYGVAVAETQLPDYEQEYKDNQAWLCMKSYEWNLGMGSCTFKVLPMPKELEDKLIEYNKVRNDRKRGIYEI